MALLQAFVGLKAKFNTMLVALISTVPQPGFTEMDPILPLEMSKGKLPSSSISSCILLSLSLRSVRVSGNLEALILSRPVTYSPKWVKSNDLRAASMAFGAPWPNLKP